jgi:hypothetical protein
VKFFVSTLACLYLFTFFIHPSGKSEEPAVLEDPGKAWTLLLPETGDGTEDQSAGTLAKGLDIALLSHLEHITEHHYLIDEKSEYQKYLIEKKREELSREAADIRRNIDLFLLQGDREGVRKKRIELEALLEKRAALTGASVPEHKPFLIKKSGSMGLTSQSLPSQSLTVHQADASLENRIEKAGDRFILTSRLTAPFILSDPLEYTTLFESEDLEKVVTGLVDHIRRILLGRPWAAWEVASGSDDVTVFMDGIRVGKGDLSNLFPGSYRFIIAKPGFLPAEKEIYLSPSERRKDTLQLVPLQAFTVAVDSLPPGSRVYQDGRYVGGTPVDFASPFFPSHISVEKEGYRSLSFTQEARSGAYVLELEKETWDRQNLVTMKRRSFYNAFGIFLLSIPISMISYGMGMEYGVAASEAINNGSISFEERSRLVDANRMWYTAYLGGLSINFFLGANALYRLIEYMNTYESVNLTGRK